ncbi:MAG: sigma-E processing peptidase SpoIIGA [Clostridia bacterium]|nr:sigma-E processing peptidase SpoIIGA [Clostridia bacterium]
MVIYIDVLLGLNMFVNYFLLLATGGANRTRPPFIRLLLGALTGAAVSLIIFLPPLHFLLDTLFKALWCGVMVLVTFSFKGLRRFLRFYGTFLGMSFSFAGVMLAIWFAFKPQGMAINNFTVYFNVSPVLLILSTVVSYMIIKLVCRFSEKKAANGNIYKLEISMNAHSVCCDALLDTGNSLRDLFSGDPVIVVEYDLIKPLLTKRAQYAFSGGVSASDYAMDEKYRLIPYSAVGKEGFLPAFRPESVCVRLAGKEFKTNKVMIAVSSGPISSEYKALIGNDIAENL